MTYQFDHSIQDGKLDSRCGRIVVYKTAGVKSNGPSRDHNDLITALAAQYGIPRAEVGNNGYRYYWRPESRDVITICPVRRIDEDYLYDHVEQFNQIIDNLFKRR